jgi:cytochrome P450
MFYILENPSIRQRLEDELLSVKVTPDNSYDKVSLKLSVLERLPYLTGCVQECIRLSHGVTSPLARIAPDQVLKLDGYEIPPGTPVAMSAVLVHLDPKVFPGPNEFRPERWLENPRLDRYLLSFSKGSRQCVGINLAYAELYMALGGIFRKFAKLRDKKTLTLYETSREDVEIVSDMFLPCVKKGSKGVRAVFERIES